ncbi:MAG: response regulator [Cyanobacteria bacterium P01_F01_bin.53]
MVKILVIEDEVEIRANLLELLALEGYDIVGADNGVTGLVGAMKYKPDLILCDVMMPELNGYDVLAALRQEPKTAMIPFIFLTALADKGDIRKGMELGSDDYLTKPFTCAEILNAVQSRLQKQTLITQQQQAEQAQLAKLQQEVQQFRDALDSDQAALISDIRQQMKEVVTKLNLTHDILKTLPAGEQRDRSIALLQNVCANEIKMLTRIPNFEYLAMKEALPSVPGSSEPDPSAPDNSQRAEEVLV